VKEVSGFVNQSYLKCFSVAAFNI